MPFTALVCEGPFLPLSVFALYVMKPTSTLRFAAMMVKLMQLSVSWRKNLAIYRKESSYSKMMLVVTLYSYFHSFLTNTAAI